MSLLRQAAAELLGIRDEAEQRGLFKIAELLDDEATTILESPEAAEEEEEEEEVEVDVDEDDDEDEPAEPAESPELEETKEAVATYMEKAASILDDDEDNPEICKVATYFINKAADIAEAAGLDVELDGEYGTEMTASEDDAREAIHGYLTEAADILDGYRVSEEDRGSAADFIDKAQDIADEAGIEMPDFDAGALSTTEAAARDRIAYYLEKAAMTVNDGEQDLASSYIARATQISEENELGLEDEIESAFDESL